MACNSHLPPLRRAWVNFLDDCEYRAGRVRCRLFRSHNRSCRGRQDHLAERTLGERKERQT